MPIVQLLVTILVCSLVWWLLQTYVFPNIAEPFRTVFIVVLVVCVCVWLLWQVGMIGPLNWRFPVR